MCRVVSCRVVAVSVAHPMAMLGALPGSMCMCMLHVRVHVLFLTRSFVWSAGIREHVEITSTQSTQHTTTTTTTTTTTATHTLHTSTKHAHTKRHTQRTWRHAPHVLHVHVRHRLAYAHVPAKHVISNTTQHKSTHTYTRVTPVWLPYMWHGAMPVAYHMPGACAPDPLALVCCVFCCCAACCVCVRVCLCVYVCDIRIWRVDTDDGHHRVHDRLGELQRVRTDVL